MTGVTSDSQRLFVRTGYAAAIWDQPRVVIINAEHGPRGANPRSVVTNIGGDAQALYNSLYGARGEIEKLHQRANAVVRRPDLGIPLVV